MENTVNSVMGKCPKLPWMVEFHSTADGKILNDQMKAAFADSYLEHLSSLHERSKVKMKRMTQFSIVIPPRVSIKQIEAFLECGMSLAVIRLDFFTVEEVKQTVDLLNRVNEDFGRKIGRVYPLAIGLDISEPEIVTGKLVKPLKEIELEKGQMTKVLANPEFANRVSKEYIYVNYENISEVVKPGDSLILGDDNIRMSALEVARDIVNCIIDKTGLLVDNLSVTLPNVPLPIAQTASHDNLSKINETCAIDIVFVGPAKVSLTKEIFGATILIFVKVEYASTVEIFEQIVKDADGVLVDGEKLLATCKENCFIVQKSIFAKCNKFGKPVMATISCHTITKSQVNDIANTVIDGADGLLLPPDDNLLQSISLICKSAEGAIYQRQLFDDLSNLKPPPIEPIISVALAAVEASFKSNAAAIILLTTTGRSARLISTYRPRCPIIALTRFGRIAKQLMVYRGVVPIFYVQKNGDAEIKMERKMQVGMTFAKSNGYVKTGDAVVIVFGMKNNVGFRNCMEVVFASEYDTIPEEEPRTASW